MSHSVFDRRSLGREDDSAREGEIAGPQFPEAEHHHDHHDSDADPYAWTDPKRHLWLLGLIPAGMLFPALAFYAGANALAGHSWLGVETPWQVIATLTMFLPWVMVFVFIPIQDYVFGRDGSNPPEEIREKLEADKYYRWIVYLYVPLQYATLVMACYLWTADDLSWLGHAGPMGFVAKLGVLLAAGIAGGIGINTAHELGHKIETGEKWASKITLATTFYGHFYTEHNRGHHARVATPEDPASSRFGESYYRFLPRTVFGSLRSAWGIERERLRRQGKPVWSIRNDNLNAWAMSVALFAVLTAVFGWAVLPWLIAQAIYGFSLLEVVNYLEHYGLLRQKTDKGRYQRTRSEHSWNSDHMVTNIFLFHLQRHSDHHANPMRRFQVLRTVDEAPQLPSGYASLIVVAHFPPLWRKIMDKRVLAHYGGDVTRANIDPLFRERIIAKYSPDAHDAAATGNGAAAGTSVLTDTDAEAALAAGTSPIGTYVCPNCGHHYIEAEGEPREGFPAGTPWSEIPNDWQCPDCGVREKIDFLAVA
ncbi:fatty acid desaturase [Dietzia sp.]|uniref:fatty acid desaturase n=1 Tax=Dietzia sp. TaxID=1871616 RepID=UPI002FD881A7